MKNYIYASGVEMSARIPMSSLFEELAYRLNGLETSHGRLLLKSMDLEHVPGWDVEIVIKLIAEPESAPVEAKPVEAKPVEAKPVEAKPVEAKPVEARPRFKPEDFWTKNEADE